MERVLPKANFVFSVRPLYYVSRVLGLGLFSFTDSFVVKEINTLWILYTVILLIAVLTCGVYCTVQRVGQSGLLATIVVNEFLMMFIGALKAVSSIFISVAMNGAKSRKFISTVVKVDRSLLSDPITTYRKTFIFTLVQVFAVYSYEATLFTYDTWVWTRAMGSLSIWYFISGYPHRIVNIGGVLQFCDIVLLLRSRFQALNSGLGFILKDSVDPSIVFTNVAHESASSSVVMRNENSVSEDKSVTIIPFRDSSQFMVNRIRQPRFKILKQKNVHDFREIYDDLCDISVLINSMYGFQLLLELGVTTFELILSSYLMLATILGIHNVETDTISQFISLMTAWLLQYAFKLISITAPCHSATTEAENTAVLVQKLLLVPNFDHDTVAELQLFSQQLLQRKIKFTAFGFLILDYSLLFTIIGGVTTFLVVAMQYSN
ncbi:putative gustatory receptor 28b [Zootermopsis nevadensis]|uniref:Gustatory receptor n=1 Tax=Zootermopsis nevadensis TaxID=136037 RepID=A0A067R566_ZOONE|nr:putative gustatory receptor 28b [Zootermopsis nevadensis]KDR17318.1 hypothetical protein L798_08520 [Zootermopsis nevadensis]